MSRNASRESRGTSDVLVDPSIEEDGIGGGTLQALLLDVTRSTHLQNAMPIVWIRLRCQAHALVPELVRTASGKLSMEQVACGFLLYMLIERAPSVGTGDWTRDRSSEVINQGLSRGDDDVRMLLCRLLSQGPVPDECVAELQSLARMDGSDLSVAAATAVTWRETNNLLFIKILKRGLKSQAIDLSINAAKALLRLTSTMPSAEETLVDALDHNSDTCFSVLMALSESAQTEVDLSQMVAAIVLDDDRPVLLRAVAAHTLGVVAIHVPSALSALDIALQDDDLFLVESAASGCKALGCFPDGAAERFASWLGHPSSARHDLALEMLALMGAEAAPALQTLIVWIGSDLGGGGPGALANALGACGVEAIPYLLTGIRSKDLSGASVCSAALVAMGGTAVPAIEELLSADLEPQAFGMVLAVARELGPQAHCLVPRLNHLLLSEAHDALLGLILKTVGATGPAAINALPGLLRCLLVGNDTIADEAERILRMIGPQVLPVLVDVARHTSGDQAERIRRVVADWDVLADPRFRKLIAFDDDACLERFMHAAEYLCEHGPSSHRVMAEAFHERKCDGRMDRGCSTSQRALGQAFKDINDKLSIVVTTQSEGRKGGITPEGRALLEDVKDYLRHRHMRNG